MSYAVPAIPVYFLIGPLYIVQGIYAKYFGLELEKIGMVLLISRFFDAITDPVIGYYSDRYYAKHCSRKPLILVGAVLLTVSSWFLYVPPTSVSLAYFLVWFLTFYFAYTLFEIPHLSWANDISFNSTEKNHIYAWRASGMYIGSLLFFSVPLLPIFESHSFTPETLRWTILIVAILMGPSLVWCLSKVPNSRPQFGQNKKNNMANQKSSDYKISSYHLIGNTPLLWFLISFLLSGVGVGMWFVLIFLFVESYLNQGDSFALTYVAGIGVSILTLTIWPRLAEYFGKKSIWIFSILMITTGLLGTGNLLPNEHARGGLLLCMIFIYCGFTALNVIAPSILGDIVDYGVHKYGVELSGKYFSLYTLTMKGSLAIGGSLGLFIAGWYGFDAMAESQSLDAIFGMRLACAWLPALIVLMSTISIVMIPTINLKKTIDDCMAD